MQDRLITRFGLVRNYAVRMTELYYSLYSKTLTNYTLSNHIARKKKRNCATAKLVEGLPSQAVQECLARVYKGMQNFFTYCDKVDRWLASSQTCHKCGYKNTDTKNLKVMEWVCPNCGAHLDRDKNAAMNILLGGISSSGLGVVRPAPQGGADAA